MLKIIILFFCLLSLTINAKDDTKEINNEVNINLNQFINYMVKQHDFDIDNLNNLFKKVKIKQSILKVMSRPGEAKPWYKYKHIFVNQRLIKAGVKFWKKNKQTLIRAEKKYKIPAEIIVAIIGVETAYGRNTGSFKILDSLSTLAFHYPRRADFFREELEYFLLFTRQENINPLTKKGSYAGAMGIGQFMPSSYRKYAIDFNSDNKVDIWNIEDAIGSVANYLHEYGWLYGQDIIIDAKATPKVAKELLSLGTEPQKTLTELKDLGLEIFSNDSHDKDEKGFLIELKTEIGKAHWVGLQNFYVISRYNHSWRYSMAVYRLANKIKNSFDLAR
jgi:membrane-bound lytic murein transglycosylase B